MPDTELEKTLNKSPWKRILYSFSIRSRLMAVNIAFIIPLTVLLYFVIGGIHQNINSATLEVKGNGYQRILISAIEQKQYFLSGEKTASTSAAPIDTTATFARLEEYSLQHGGKLQISDAALKQRQKHYLGAAALREEWMKLAAADAAHTNAQAAAHDTYIAHIFELINYIGDSSNLILDPDLDSYHTMSVTVLALPNLLKRLQNLIDVTHGGATGNSVATRTEMFVLARLLSEDVHNIHGNIHTALAEDGNFYGVSPRFKITIMPVLEQFEASLQELIAHLSSGVTAPDSVKEAALRASMRLWEAAAQELHALLNIRIRSFEGYQVRVLALTTLAVLFALVLFWVLTSSITRPLLKLQKTMAVIADNARNVAVPYQDYQDEIGVMARAIEWFRNLQQLASQQHIDLMDARDKAEKANAYKGEFLANMSHELRTPLNSVMGMTRLLQTSKLGAEQRQLVDTVLASSTNLLEIVNDILDLSKIEAGEMKLEHIGMDPAYLLHNVVQTLEHIAREKHLHLIKNYENEELPYVLGDPTRLTRIFTNLIGNAIKYTDRGYIEVRASCVTLDATHVELHCAIKDTGIGIPEAKHGSIFEKFVQGDTSTTREYGGTGLGLAITRQLVEMMGGTIGVESVVGAGSTFAFTIPFTVTDKHVEEPRTKKQRPLSGIIRPEQARTLVAEDHPMNQKLIAKLLPSFGITNFEIADNGTDVLRRFQEAPWDIILMDCHMPKKNGYDTTRAIRDLEKNTGNHVAIVAMTANAMVGDKEKCLRCGMDDYISKPISIDELKQILGQWICFEDRTAVVQNSPSPAEESGILDLSLLRAFTADNKDSERELIRAFIDQSDKCMQTLAECRGPDSIALWQETAHLLKGGAGGIGAKQLAALCAEAQHFTGTPREQAALFAKIQSAYRRVKEMLEATGAR